MSSQTEVSALFGLRLSADLLTALVVTGVLSKAAAGALVDDALANLLESHPEHETELREISGALVAQVGLVSLDFDRLTKRDS